MTFDAFFAQANADLARHAAAPGPPFPYQRALAMDPHFPEVLLAPTGSGKTRAVLTAWLFQRRMRPDSTPRRLIYALPMRTLVEQTHRQALTIRENLGLREDELRVELLMGGEPVSDWREHPETDTIAVGTIDLLLSRALNRGYGESRFQWPVAFGLLNTDAQWVLDEVQLMGQASTTSAQLQGLRRQLGTSAPVRTMWMSATIDERRLITFDHPQIEGVLRLDATDRDDPRMTKRLNAVKRLRVAETPTASGVADPKAVAATAIEHHQPGTRTIVVLNRVTTAQNVFTALQRQLKDQPDAPELALLHSRFRPPDRALASERAVADPTAPGLIVVATQVIEAGIDLTSRVLITETAPWSSIVQRLGRCNRAGEADEGADVVWLDTGDPDAKAAAPYDPDDLAATAVRLRSLDGVSLSPSHLEHLQGTDPVPEVIPEAAVLRRVDLLDLFDTAPDVAGADIDVSPFVRDGDDRSVAVAFRRIVPTDPVDEDDDLLLFHGGRATPGEEQPLPVREELVPVPIGDLVAARGPVSQRHVYRYDHIYNRWDTVRPGELRPGMTVLVDQAAGGYSPVLGWSKGLKGPVPEECVGPPDVDVDHVPEPLDGDPLTVGRHWVRLEHHLADVDREAQALGAALSLSAADADALRRAAALHDVGKAHVAFQAMLLSTLGDDDRSRHPEVLWAKSAGGRGRHQRPFFRHELASVLALEAEEVTPLLGDQPDLVRYLIAAHHGKVRMAIRPAPGEIPLTAAELLTPVLGVLEGDQVPAVGTPIGTVPASTLSLGLSRLGAARSWTDRIARLRDDPNVGPFRLGYLEALIRIADWRGSAAPATQEVTDA